MVYHFLPALGLAATVLLASPVCAQIGIVPMDQLIGLNTRASDPVRYVRYFENVRVYHSWVDDVGDAPSNTAQCPDDFNAWANSQYLRYRFNPSFSNAAWINYDDYYRTLYQRSIPVLQGLAPMMRGYNGYPYMAPQLLDQKPFCLNGWYQWNYDGATPPLNLLPGNQSDPGLYRSHALWATLQAARFGARAFSTTSKYYTKFLFDHYVTEGWHSTYDDRVERDPAASGLGYVRYLECGNEPEKSWYDPWWAIDQGQGQTYFQATASQYAAQLSADYDGHGRSPYFRIASMPDSLAWLGIKNTDPDMKVVFAGLADFRGKYVQDVIDWCRTNRQPGVNGFASGPVLPFDVLSFHHYSTIFSSTDAFGTNSLAARYDDIRGVPIFGQAISPEDDNLRGELTYLASRLQQYEPEVADKQIWLTEFGYDSDGLYSAVRVPEIAGQDRQTTQGQWLVRAFLEIAATRRVSRAMMYELRDEPNLANSHYGYSGLMTADYRPKRAWYYVQTLKNVLTGYSFAPENPANGYVSTTVTNISSSNAAAAATRVYQFTRGDEADIFAIWSPTATGLSYRANLRFAPGVTFDQASLATIAEQDETGRWINWSDSIFVDADGYTVVRGLPVSETPVFLAIHVARQEMPVPPVFGLQGQALCCGSIRLSWQGDSLHQRYRVYYGRRNQLGPALPFDYTRANLKMWPEEIGGGATSVIIPGLPAKAVFRFYVVPVGPDGQPPQNWSQWPAYVETATADCGSAGGGCLIDVAPPQLTYGPGLPVPSQVLNLLSADYVPNQCGETRATGVTNSWDDWDWSSNDPAARSITIDLQQPYLLDVIYLLDSYGKGELRIEARACSCSEWELLTDVMLNVDFDRWMQVANLRAVPVRYLRISKLDPGAQVRRILFCGQPASCAPATGSPAPISAAASLAPRVVRAHSAVLRWATALFDPARPSLGQATRYRVRYGTNWNAGGTLIAPKEVWVSAGMWDRVAETELVGLAPGASYLAEVTPVLGPAACAPALTMPVSTIFTTPGAPLLTGHHLPAEARGSAAAEPAGTAVQPAMRLYPNPATHAVRVVAVKSGYTRLRVLDAAGGRVVMDQEIGEEEREWNVEVNPLPGGTYVVRLEGPEGMAVERLVVVRG